MTTVEQLSIQKRIDKKNINRLGSQSGVLWFVDKSKDIADWWSPRRDFDLRDFYLAEGNDILQGAVSSLVKKFKSMNWSLKGPKQVVSKSQDILANSEFGKGWGTLLSKTITDYLTQDQGAFWELIGKGNTTGSIVGPVLGIAHLDSKYCQLTGDPIYPVLFNNPKDNKSRKLHFTRVVHLVDMPSPMEEMNEIGFCAVSRTIASSNVLLKLNRYKNEKLSDLPPAGLLLLNNILPGQWDDASKDYSRERRRLGQELWASVMTFFGMDPSQPTTAEFVSFADLPDAFNELETTNIYINIVALAFGVDAREFWPVSVGPLGTAAEASIQHQKARGKGVGDIISVIERAINWKVIPVSAHFKFDFADDSEDLLRAEVNDLKTKTIMNMFRPQKVGEVDFDLPVTSKEIRQMLALNVEYFRREFLAVEEIDQIEAIDIEREKMYGPIVEIDDKGIVYIEKKKNIDRVFAIAKKNYDEGLIPLDSLIEFRLGEVLDEYSSL